MTIRGNCDVTVAARQVEGPPRPMSQFDQPKMLPSDGAGYGMHPRPLYQQMEAVSTPVLTGNDFLTTYICTYLESLSSIHVILPNLFMVVYFCNIWY